MDAKENCEEKGKREIWRNGRGMWKMLLRTGLEAQSYKARSAKRSFPLPKGVSGDSLWHTGTRDVERGKKEERWWIEAYPENGEEKCFPKCLNQFSLHLFSVSESVISGSC